MAAERAESVRAFPEMIDSVLADGPLLKPAWS
jgi:hypothetical protein